jgi:hypothetical protein
MEQARKILQESDSKHTATASAKVLRLSYQEHMF